jgi:hypothetical protein
VHDSGKSHAASSRTDADGVRIVRHGAASVSPLRRVGVVAVVLLVSGIGYAILAAKPRPGDGNRPADATQPAPAMDNDRNATVQAAPEQLPLAAPRAAAAIPQPSTQTADDWPSADPNDLASHISPTDPEPTMAEVIDAMHAAGDHTGIGAFNPPGTSPPLQGLAVPDDFVLPPGYVRHHQVTDQGEPLEAILMFSPDFVLRDRAGNAVPIPEDRVVPAELAPPGLPIRQIEIPPQ